MRRNNDGTYRAVLDGEPVGRWFWADVSTGEICLPEIHWRTHEPVMGADGQPSQVIIKGEVVLTAVPTSPGGDNPLYGGGACGGPPQDQWQDDLMCCAASFLSGLLLPRIREMLNADR